MGDVVSAVVSVSSATECHGGAVHGVYYRDELEALGIGDRERREMLAAGELGSPRKDWFAVPAHHTTVHEAVRGGGVLSCLSALKYYGFWVPPGYPEVHVRRARGAAKYESSCRGFSRIAAGRTAVDPVAVALECAARCMREEDWIAVCDSVQNSLEVSAEMLRAEMGDLPQRVQEWFGRTDARSQSGTESVVRVRLRSLGYKVTAQPRIDGVGHTDLRIGRLLIECDGRQYHSSAAEFQADRTRDRKAVVDGWIVIRLTYDDVLFGWAEVLEDIRAIATKDRHRSRRPAQNTGR
ncbi:endonuclease domain-containing protein [Gordonia sp. (in: high G+C Gram-positive bacteria)]|uniref:endonuclease domain-containing protein n=1 Tax=Gordonia sp. (in: high G+C Gram-positive bacteria) TaxID=84139 RepID=UPI003528D30E